MGQSQEPRPHTRVDDESAIERKYAFGDVLGQGSFGVVREVTNRLTGLQYAMKIVNKDKVSEYKCQLQLSCINVVVATPLYSTYYDLWPLVLTWLRMEVIV